MTIGTIFAGFYEKKLQS